MMVSPKVTCPSPASATWFSLRTSNTVVLRTIGVSLDIFGKGHYRNSLEGKSSAALDVVTGFQIAFMVAVHQVEWSQYHHAVAGGSADFGIRISAVKTPTRYRVVVLTSLHCSSSRSKQSTFLGYDSRSDRTD